MGKRKFKKFSELNRKLQSVICFVTAFVVSFLIFKFIFMLGYVPTESMEPTIKAESFCLGTRLVNPDKCEVGDILMFEHDGAVLVKRVAAVGGQEFIADTGETFKVPEEHFFMLGDNVDNSYDSRYWEEPYVSKDDIVAKLILP
ncbi:MAG: S26 family signal peptidase [Acutalibacteraceae bacterium]|nr:S26 family signal peptidase [Acutalibacteraceae bacterium]